ncbi:MULTISPECIES: glycoside hydrolase family 13 protein [Niallia]|uniref:glycoside hydrolase family 13 protein n=1 Tax=Niallia TaxID=2837506 RepID=UPI000F44F967|nr:alpha-glucosidase [Niallia circulans]AYV67706.1 glucohydrolase [Niallia circulans]AYV73950.1 glucohydrolase [Niallia circulans]NRG29950.1 alpha-glucosidase [Niallia circulans]QJX63630.1 alpha-glucosidase [Niallia circulans]UQZ76266.1 glucohydrolase [Niallia circulans]
MTQKWWKEAVAYQIYPRSFMDSNGDGIGDLKGIITKLDYLKELGIDCIWICPMYKSPNDDNGYDISDYQDIMDEFGTMDDFDLLLYEVHQRGMKLIIDLVINHTSDEHEWFVESRSSLNNPKRDWYIWRDGVDGKEPNNWESIFGGSAWKLDEATGQYFMHIFSTKQPDLNWENEEVRKALYNMINWWLDKGIDGFRIDAISHIKKEEGLKDMDNPLGLDYVPSFDKHMNVEGIQPFLEELKNETFAKYDIMTVGEANGVKVEEAELWVGETKGKFNMVFQFEHLDLWDNEKNYGVDVMELKQVLNKWQKGLENKGWNALFIENHDKARSVSTWGNDKEYWKESAKALGMMYFFMQGTPFIYQGQEIGMTNVQFPTIEEYDDVATKNLYKLKREEGFSHKEVMEIIWSTSRDNSRTPMQWSSDEYAGFSDHTPWMGMNPNYLDINVESQKQDPDSIYHFYKKMIELKKSGPILTYGTFDLVDEENKQVFAYTRTLDDKKMVIISNLSAEEAVFENRVVELEHENLLLANYPVEEHEPTTSISLKPYEARLYTCK